MNSAAIYHTFADGRDEPTGPYELGSSSSNVSGEAARSSLRERILIVEVKADFQSSLAQALREAGLR